SELENGGATFTRKPPSECSVGVAHGDEAVRWVDSQLGRCPSHPVFEKLVGERHFDLRFVTFEVFGQCNVRSASQTNEQPVCWLQALVEADADGPRVGHGSDPAAARSSDELPHNLVEVGELYVFWGLLRGLQLAPEFGYLVLDPGEDLPSDLCAEFLQLTFYTAGLPRVVTFRLGSPQEIVDRITSHECTTNRRRRIASHVVLDDHLGTAHQRYQAVVLYGVFVEGRGRLIGVRPACRISYQP